MRLASTLLAAAIALVPLASTNAAAQPEKKKPKSSAPQLPPARLSESDRKDLMSLSDVLGVTSLSAVGVWSSMFITHKSEPLSNSAACKALLTQSDPKTRGPKEQRRGDIGEYNLVLKYRAGIEKTFGKAADFGGKTKEPVAYPETECFRFASSGGQTVGILVVATRNRLNKSQLNDSARATKAVNDFILPLTDAFTDLATADAPPMLGVVVTYGLQATDDPKTVQPFGESVSLVWETKSLTDFKSGAITREHFLQKAQAFFHSPTGGDFTVKRITLKP